jgi:hypothetical protein
MNSNHRAMPANKADPVLAILWAGLLCGTMDIIAAFVVYGAFGLQPLRILKGIAAGLLGPSAFQGGNGIAVLGLACHFTVAFLAAAAFVTVSRYWKFLVDHVSRPRCDLRPSVRPSRLFLYAVGRDSALRCPSLSFFSEIHRDRHHHPHLLRGTAHRGRHPQVFRALTR